MSDLKKRKRAEGLGRVENYINIILLHEDHTIACFSIPASYIDSPSHEALDEMTGKFQSCYVRCDAEFDSDEKKQTFEKYEKLLESALFGDEEPNGKARWEEFKVKENEIHFRPGVTYFLRDSNGLWW
jgi:hypothetical protein